MKKTALLWLNAILFYDLRKAFSLDFNKDKKKHLEWLNSRKPLSVRIKEYNKVTQ
tara:strand:- start:710 stop:874 length:165 start_codon:yes stop_codon:yes gene_type:complete